MLGEVVHLVKECEWRKKGAQEGRPRARKKTDLQGKLKLDQMISRRLKLEQINDAFDELRRGELARSVIVFDQ